MADQDVDGEDETMSTFQQWLSEQENRPGNDPVGWLAKQWKSIEGNRPRVSSPTGIKRHLAQLSTEDRYQAYLGQAVHQAVSERYAEMTGQPLAEGRSPSPEELAAFQQQNQPPPAERSQEWAVPPQEVTEARTTRLSGEGEIGAMPAAGDPPWTELAAEQHRAWQGLGDLREMVELRSGDIGTLGIDVTAIRRELAELASDQGISLSQLIAQLNMIETVVLAIAHRVGITPDDLAAVGASYAPGEASLVTDQVDPDVAYAESGIREGDVPLATQSGQLNPSYSTNGFADWWGMADTSEGGPDDG